jgi:hypothetical protein
MADFHVSCEPHPDKSIKANTHYAAAQRYGETVLQGEAKDEEEFAVRVISRETGAVRNYTIRAEVTTHWVVTLDKDKDDDQEAG